MTRQLIQGDNLSSMKAMDDNIVDLIYLDPPFNTGRDFVAYNDKWETDDEYILFIKERLVEGHRLLKDTGTIYLHCDPTMSHYLKILMDKIFGRKNFRNEIVWCYGAGNPPKKDFARKHDVIFRFTKTNKYIFNTSDKIMREPFSKTAIEMHFTNVDENGRHYRKYDSGNIAYADEGKVIRDFWTDIDGQQATSPLSPEYTGYPTQKPCRLLERIITASSNPGDLVLDPFAGSCTTCVAAEKLGRQWIGMDMWEGTEDIVNKRMEDCGIDERIKKTRL